MTSKTYKIFIIILIFFSLKVLCFEQEKVTGNWNLQITYTNYEVKNFKLKKSSYKPYLPRTSWRCNIGPVQYKKNSFYRKLSCNYSIKKTGVIKSTIICSKLNPYSEFQVELFDERKQLTYKVLLFCNLTHNI